MKTLLPVCLAVCTALTGCLPPPPPYRGVAPGYSYYRNPYPGPLRTAGYGPYAPVVRRAPGPVYPVPHRGVYSPGRVVRGPGAVVRGPSAGVRGPSAGVRGQGAVVRGAAPAQGKPAAAAGKPAPGKRKPGPGGPP